MKNILVLTIATAIVVTVIEISTQSQKVTIQQPAKQKTTGVGAADRKFQIEQAKKNTVLRRFVS